MNSAFNGFVCHLFRRGGMTEADPVIKSRVSQSPLHFSTQTQHRSRNPSATLYSTNFNHSLHPPFRTLSQNGHVAHLIPRSSPATTLGKQPATSSRASSIGSKFRPLIRILQRYDRCLHQPLFLNIMHRHERGK
jgi:hypothetical protein